MKPTISKLILTGAAAALLGCGYVGPPLPPALNIPEPITDLSVAQQAGRIVIEFTPSLKATDGLILPSLSAIELRAGERPEGEFSPGAWAASAAPIKVDGAKAEPTKLELPVDGWEGRDLIFGVRSIGPRGRPSGWSNLVALRIVAPPPAPAGLSLQTVATGVLLRWQGGGEGSFRVYRRAKSEKEETLIGTAANPELLDETARFDIEYTYRVQRVVATGGREAESPFSSPAVITPVDTFAPAVPAGLTVQAGIGAVELAWDRNMEADLFGYQVWRGAGDEPLERLGSYTMIASFSDKTVETGKSYRYAVSSLDKKGNESAPCAPSAVQVQ